jgi:hypothetical protein
MEKSRVNLDAVLSEVSEGNINLQIDDASTQGEGNGSWSWESTESDSNKSWNW